MNDTQLSRLNRLAALPDHAIDTSDIPEISDWPDAVRGDLRRPRKPAATTPRPRRAAEPAGAPPHPTTL